jgi:hypothetical protein
MIFVKLDRLMSEIIDFADSNINSTIFFILFEKKSNRLRFEPTALGFDFSMIIFSVLAIAATRIWLILEIMVSMIWVS